MGSGDVLTWIMVGIVAGGLAGSLIPARAPIGLVGVMACGVLGALVGGWGWELLFGHGPSSFLGSVIVGVLGALAVLALLRRHGRTRYDV